MKILLPSLFALVALPIAAQQDHSFTLVSTQTTSGGETREDRIEYSFEGPNTAILIPGVNGQPDVRMIFKPEEKSITQLHEINGLKGGFVFTMSEKRWPGMAYSSAEVSTQEMQWTGKTRSMDGHECHEAKVGNEEYNGTAWVAKDIPLSLVRVFSYQSVGAGKSTKEDELLSTMGLSGLPLEMHLKSRTDKPDVVLRILNYREVADASLFNTAGHSTTYVQE